MADELTPGIGWQPPASGIVDQTYQGPTTPTVGNPTVEVPGGVTRVSRYGQVLTRLRDGQLVQAHDNWLPEAFRAPGVGTVRIQATLDAAVHLLVSTDAGTNWQALNGGAAVVSGAVLTANYTVVPGDEVKVATDATATITGGRVLYVTDLL
jgi:hypothetical protein